jgi:hypothetical protein
MATSKTAGTTQRSSSGRSSKKSEEPDVSPARWAGVALVIAAIVGAILLAVISPSNPDPESDPGLVAEASSPSPVPTELGGPVPVGRPVIVSPGDGTVTPEFEIEVAVDVPEDVGVPKKLLTLYIYHGDEIDQLDKPKLGTTVTVQGVRLTAGENTLTAAFGGPGGPGPISEPVVVTLDENAPKLEITSPKKGHETYDERVLVEFTSEVGAEVQVRNEAKSFDQPLVVGPGGAGTIAVALKRGNNRIEATSIDEAGQEQTAWVRVKRLDGRPFVKLKYPETIKRSELPTEIRVVAEVKDGGGDPMRGAEVHFSLGGPDRTALSEIGTTNTNGRAVWNPTVTASSSPADALELGVVVISSLTDDQKTLDRSITLQ